MGRRGDFLNVWKEGEEDEEERVEEEKGITKKSDWKGDRLLVSQYYSGTCNVI